ncbi:metallophosphoesterase [Heyndrickxia sp. NPDC080065]|uniref:metallophosphoesterase n=1 Tax=Heyndrickxia sp. NPDC080065 TaxID=3390568 RepID=UPI003CFF7BE0
MIYSIIFIFLAGLFLLIFMILEAFQNKVYYHTFEFQDFPNSFKTLKIFFISDIHRRKINPLIINEAMGKVDIVIIGGDLTEEHVPFEQVEYNIIQLGRLGRTFFVWGNNDYEVRSEKLIQLFEKHNVVMLRNDTEILKSTEGEKIAIIGIDDISLEKDDLHLAMQKVDHSCFQILISHNPNIIKKITNIHSISFILSGHTHGGQIRIFGYSPYKRGGIYTYPFVTQLISNGYGTSMFPLRLGAKPETHIIRLKKSKK